MGIKNEIEVDIEDYLKQSKDKEKIFIKLLKEIFKEINVELNLKDDFHLKNYLLSYTY